MGNSFPQQHVDPVGDMNVVPLIDVLLVLLIMFIITIPLQTHAVKLDLPQPCADCPEPSPIRNVVSVNAKGAISWNDVPVNSDQLRSTIAATQELDPLPELHLLPHPEAPYSAVDEVLAITKRAGVRNMGFVGNERYRDF